MSWHRQQHRARHRSRPHPQPLLSRDRRHERRLMAVMTRYYADIERMIRAKLPPDAKIYVWRGRIPIEIPTSPPGE